MTDPNPFDKSVAAEPMRDSISETTHSISEGAVLDPTPMMENPASMPTPISETTHSISEGAVLMAASAATLSHAEKSATEKLSQTLSWALHPFVLPIYVIGVMLTTTVFAFYPVAVKWYLVWVVMLYTIALPALSIGLLYSLGRISDWRLDRPSERLWPLAIGVVCYVLCALTLSKIPSVDFLRKFMVAAACCEALCLMVTFRWKISLHLTAMGAVVALFVLLNVLGVGNMQWSLVVAILCSGALASARLHLGCHNPLQVLIGFCSGFTVAILAMLFL